MLSAKQLMIGNVVHDINGEPYTIKAQSFENIHNNTLTVFGVPLTAEVLLSFGFGQEKENEFSDRCDWYFKVHDTGFRKGSVMVFSFNEVDGSKWLLAEINHLHQLQNLFFILTGHTLTPTPNLKSKK